MTTGTKFDAKFEHTIDGLQRSLSAATADYDRMLERQRQLQAAISKSLRRIGVTQAQALESGEAIGDDPALAPARPGLLKRAERLRVLNLELPVLESAAAARVADRTAARDAHDVGAAELAAFYTECDVRLTESGEHAALVAEVKATQAQHREAEARASAAEEEHARKSAAYMDDPIFAYLHAAGFGTERYSGNRLVRMVDGWLARLCNYDRAAIDYRALTELPGYLAGIAKTLKASAAQADQRLRDGVLAARRLAGSEAKEAHVAQLLQRRNVADEAATAARGMVREAMRERDQIMLWEDPISRSILDGLATAYAGLAAGQLGSLVKGTSSADDDEAAASIESLRAEYQDLEKAKDRAIKEVESLKQRLSSVRSVRSRFRSENYDSGSYAIGSDADGLLLGLAAGSISHDTAWSRLKSETRYDPPYTPPSSTPSDSGGIGGSSLFDTGGSIGGGSGDTMSTGGGF